MPPKRPTVAPLMMTLRSRGRSQDIQTKESKLEVTEGESKRKVRKNLKQEAVEEELNNNVTKDQSEQKVCKEKLKPAATTCVERRKREGKETHRDAKLAKIVAVVTEEKKKNVRQCKNKSCEDMEKAVLGNEESDQVEAVKEKKKKRKTATDHLQSHQPRSDALSAESQSDGKVETFSTEDWSVIEGIKARAERIFDVKLVACQEEERFKAADVTIYGSNRETRLLCKEYLIALTRPGCATIFPYPPEEHSFLTESAVHDKLERDSQAFLTFCHVGEVEIYGLDSLSVALAMSSLESMLENHRATESNAPSVSDNARQEKEDLTKCEASSRRTCEGSSRRSSLLLDVELKNWMSSSEDDIYRNTNEAVRHSILSVVKDESREVRMEAAQIHGSPLKVASPALRSSALKLLSEAYMSLLDDSAAPLSPFTTDGNQMASLGTESVEMNILKDSDFASGSLQHKDKIPAEAETMQREIENSATETETKQSEIASSFTADETIQDRRNLTTEAKAKHTKIVNEYVINKDSERKINGIIVSLDSESEAEKNRYCCSKTTSIKSNGTDRKVYVHSNGLSCEIRVPSGNQKPGQIHSQKPGINLPAAELHGTRNSCSHTSTTLDNQMVSSATKTIQVDAVSSTKLLSDSVKQMQLTQNPTGSNPVAPPVIYPLLSIAAQPPTSSLASAGKLRYVVIDGSNVAMAHGKNQAFSCPGIEICIKYFLQRGHLENQITAFVPQSRLCRPRPSHKPIVGQHLLQKLADRGLVVFTPARKVPGRNIVCYDDRYVLRLAAHTNGIIVTNDNYRDLWLERGEWREIIENRLLPFSFVNDLFMPPDDPLGRNGPSLNQFLTDQQQQPCLGQQNHNANRQTGSISTNAKLVTVKQWYQNR